MGYLHQPNIDNTKLPPLSKESKFNYIYKTHRYYIRRICLNTLQNHIENTNDMAQNYWMLIWNKIDSIDVNSPYLKTYLTRIIFNMIMDDRKNNSRLKRNIGDNNKMLSLDYNNSNIDDNNTNYLINSITSNINSDDIDLIMDIEYHLSYLVDNNEDNVLKTEIFRDRIFNQMKFEEISEKYNIKKSTCQNYFYSVNEFIKKNIDCK